MKMTSPSFSSLRRSEEVGPENVTGNSCFPFDRNDAIDRNMIPLKDSGRSNS